MPLQSEQEEKIKRLRNMICTAGREDDTKSSKAKLAKVSVFFCLAVGDVGVK